MGQPKQWKIKYSGSFDEPEIRSVSESLNISPVTAVLLINRGFDTPEKAKNFIEKDNFRFHDPYLMSDMDKAVKRIDFSLKNREKIVIYGDYDVDGVTSVSALYLFLKKHGADISYYIPNRVGEGYGINLNAIDGFAKQGIKLIITVDTGITAVDEVKYASSLGIETLVTDHHECHSEIPDAAAVINPKRADCGYPFKELAGVGVVFKLICAFEEYFCLGDRPNGGSAEEKMAVLRRVCLEYADLAAVGTVADVMPVVDENRLIVSIGLGLIEKNPRPGIEALLEFSTSNTNSSSNSNIDAKPPKYVKKRKITSSLIGYVIAPRINAAGRISNASNAVELFLTESSHAVRAIANNLCEINRERQAEENKIIEQASEKIKNEHDFKNDLVIVLADDGWHHGVIGIVSSRITEHYNMPSILISFDGDIGKGSGRSIKGMNLVGALDSCSDLLVKFGGHELAAGLSIERKNLDEFRRRINNYAREHLSEEDRITAVNIDCELQAKDITLKQINEMYLLEPYGISNQTPVYIIRDAEIVDAVPIGANRHSKFIIMKDGISFTAVYFGKSIAELDFYSGDKVDIVFNMDINDFQNVQTAQIIIRDMSFSADNLHIQENYRRIYDEIKCGRKFQGNEDFVPTREEFAEVFLYLKNEIRLGNDVKTLHSLDSRFSKLGISYVKMRFILDIFNETNIVGMEKVNVEDGDEETNDDREVYKFRINYMKNKINLEKSSIFKILKSRQQIVK